MKKQMGISLNRSSLDYFSPLIGNFFTAHWNAFELTETHSGALERIQLSQAIEM